MTIQVFDGDGHDSEKLCPLRDDSDSDLVFREVEGAEDPKAKTIEILSIWSEREKCYIEVLRGILMEYYCVLVGSITLENRSRRNQYVGIRITKIVPLEGAEGSMSVEIHYDKVENVQLGVEVSQ